MAPYTSRYSPGLTDAEMRERDDRLGRRPSAWGVRLIRNEIQRQASSTPSAIAP